MFKTLVILKVSPWYLYADSEKDALKICEQYKDDVSGLVTGENIIVKKPRMALTLEQEEVLPLPPPKTTEETIVSLTDEQLEMDIEEASKQLEEEFEKLQSGIG